MALRPFKLPADIDVLLDVLPPSFRYPDNPEWNFEGDEVENMIDSINGLRRIWPLFRLLQLLSPPLRDAVRGYVWEEVGQPVGLVNVIRRGASDQWIIGNVSVLPAYRRRGIGRALVSAAVAYVRERRATTVTLDVIDGNLPAYNLYTALGFEHYSGFTQMMRDGDGALVDAHPPNGYDVAPVAMFDWRPAYDLARRIVPDPVKRYEPVEEKRYRMSRVARWFAPVINRAMGSQSRRFVARHTAAGQVVASASISARARKGGVNGLNLLLDPAHAALSPFLVRALVGEIERVSPGRRIECEAKHWQEPARAALIEAGFTKRADMHSLGMILREN